MEIVISCQPLPNRQRLAKLGFKFFFQARHIPLVFKTFRGNISVNNFLDHLITGYPYGLGDIIHSHQGIALVINNLALLISHIVIFQQLLAHIEITTLYLLLRILDRTRYPGMFYRLAFFHPKFFHQPSNPIGTKDSQ